MTSYVLFYLCTRLVPPHSRQHLVFPVDYKDQVMSYPESI
jgi:hypothetical protein